ncbi:ABC transporter substrate-binding protein [Marinomonas rhizomae]|uniref:Peptide/nickel transport system substrate-binding protein n=1 Tax=Marinomonas rhizomae TaxID=491948 RepID=A0A366JES9_9GAMM|nr:ABC transporter substrate-binding protein [Marinomonas rhizomae]RBP84814.1 peptide/nickel transport system substrate-binding protein [Marinomonas rhizomae]RNF74991.1 ABC transporter substrate-binding protein [Marinomonas rhizomae]
MKKLLAASLLVCASSFSAFAATPPNALVVAQSLDDVTSLDPAQGFELTSVQTFTNVYQRLVQSDPQNPTNLAPTLASSWESTSNSLTITLRKDAEFASGNPVRPEDVVFSLGRVVKLNLAPSFILTQLGWNKANVDSHIHKIADDKVKIMWDVNVGPSFVLSLLSAPVSSIVDEKVVMANAENGDFGHAWLNTHSAGSGPFQIKKYIPHEALVLSANKTSPGGAPKLNLILMKNVPDAATRQLLIEQGDADIARNLGSDQFQSLQGKKGVKALALPYASLYYILFNAKVEDNPDLGNPKFWEAAHWAFDYRGIGVDLMRGQFQVQQSFLPVGFNGALTDQPYHYDPEKAKAILKEAGIENPHFKLIVSNQPPYLDVAQALQASFARAGIKVELIPGISSQVASEVKEHNFEATVSAWGPDYFDPNTNASAFAYNPENGSKTLAWRANWQIPELSKMTIAARAETDEAKRTEMYQALQKKVRESSPIVVGLQNKKLVAIREDLQGYVQGIMPDMVYYKNVSK